MESPIPRKIELIILYAVINGIPIKQIVRYRILPAIACSGVPIKRTIGRTKHITADMIAEGAVVADVGINVLEDGTLCGDVDYENVREKVSHITPVPGGVGNVTTSVLASHVLRAARIG